jgi:hypothetical protein
VKNSRLPKDCEDEPGSAAGPEDDEEDEGDPSISGAGDSCNFKSPTFCPQCGL